MSEFDVEVVETPSPHQPDRPFTRLRRAIAARLRPFLLRPRRVVFAGIAGFVLIVGTPHVGWDYECRHPIRPGQPCRSVQYCAYYGVQGRRVEFPSYGERCQLVTFLPVDWAQVFGG